MVLQRAASKGWGLGHGLESDACLLAPQELKQQIQQTRENLAKSPRSRPFFLESVEREADMQARVTRSFILLSQYDFQQCFGKAPRACDPKCPVVEVQDVDGTVQSFYAFTDPEKPFRCLELSSSVAEVRSEELLAKEGHVHATQAAQCQRSRSSSRLHSSGCNALLAKQQANLCSISEYEETSFNARWLAPVLVAM